MIIYKMPVVIIKQECNNLLITFKWAKGAVITVHKLYGQAPKVLKFQKMKIPQGRAWLVEAPDHYKTTMKATALNASVIPAPVLPSGLYNRRVSQYPNMVSVQIHVSGNSCLILVTGWTGLWALPGSPGLPASPLASGEDAESSRAKPSSARSAT